MPPKAASHDIRVIISATDPKRTADMTRENPRMKLAFFPAALAIPLLASASLALGDNPKLVKGTYQPGSNVTEPRPQESEFFETDHGGVLVSSQGVGFYLFVSTRKNLETILFARIEYENPAGGDPAENTAVISPTTKQYGFSSPEPIYGLEVYKDYTITVRLFESEESETPIDTLTQKVRSYVDNTDGEPKFFDNLEPK